MAKVPVNREEEMKGSIVFRDILDHVD